MMLKPKPLPEWAYYGPIGESIQLIAPYTEASKEAMLYQLFSLLGCMIGNKVYQLIDGRKQPCLIYVVIVGATSTARKGTSFYRIKNLCKEVNPEWIKENYINGGSSSGEGLISIVRDPYSPRSNKEKFDPGVSDKRKFLLEEEFARTLKAMGRESSTLSQLIRVAWDGQDLRIVTKTLDYAATSPHITIVGHITLSELKKLLNQVENTNGFVNRFLWVYSTRSKLLHESIDIPEGHLSNVVSKLQHGLRFCYSPRRIFVSQSANQFWKEAYSILNKDYCDPFGASIARGAAYVRRLAMLLAVFDCSELIEELHLRVAMELWRYCEDGCRLLWGEATGDRVADKVLETLRKNPDGLSRTQISQDVLKGNKSKHEIDNALAKLIELNVAGKKLVESAAVRPVEMWFSI
ncbi:MAG: hypothetical protein AB8G05_06325 [Oligoflexales bacterium]